MDVQVITPPAVEPVSLTEAKAHARIQSSAEDAVSTLKIAAARRAAEAFTGLRLITQTVRFFLPRFAGTIEIPVWPVQSVAAVAYQSAAGTWMTLDADAYDLVRARRPWRIAPAYGTTWPTARTHWDAVRIDVVAGFGDAAADVPEDIREAILQLFASAFEHREPEAMGVQAFELPGLASARNKMLRHAFFG